MKGERATLAAGSLCDEHFQLLLGGTSIRASGVMMALKDHLVNGLKKSDAVSRNGISFPQFSVRLKTVIKEHKRQIKISKFYQSLQGEGN